MVRLDVHARREGSMGYLLDMQADLLSGLNIGLVVPLLPEAPAPAPAARLNSLVSNMSSSLNLTPLFLRRISSKRVAALGGCHKIGDGGVLPAGYRISAAPASPAVVANARNG
jgi:hypothetical protein